MSHTHSIRVPSGSMAMFLAVRRALLFFLSGLAFSIAGLAPSEAQTTLSARTAPDGPFAVFVTEASRRFDMPAAWILAVMRVESGNDPRAISPRGAMGLMQIMPETWETLRARLTLGNDPFDPHDNVIAGASYLRILHDRYGTAGFLAAYNAGPVRYDAFLAGGRALPPETRAYVAQLMPLIDGRQPAASVVVAAADPLAWTQAPLFIDAADRTRTAGLVQANSRTESGQTDGQKAQAAPEAPHIDGLFVSRTSAGATK
jgi:soluble lytic murein transglycosylase-like protein